MYTVILLDENDLDVLKLNTKFYKKAIDTFDKWVKEEAFDREYIALWKNDDLLMDIHISKKTDWRLGDVFMDVNDDYKPLAINARKYKRHNNYA